MLHFKSPWFHRFITGQNKKTQPLAGFFYSIILSSSEIYSNPAGVLNPGTQYSSDVAAGQLPGSCNHRTYKSPVNTLKIRGMNLRVSRVICKHYLPFTGSAGTYNTEGATVMNRITIIEAVFTGFAVIRRS
jgi:hypothetical protein